MTIVSAVQSSIDQQNIDGISQVVFTSSPEFPRSPIIWEGMLSVEESRRLRLVQYRTIFGLASLLFLLGTAACLFLGLHYEPTLALFLSFFGTFLVFVMKVRDES